MLNVVKAMPNKEAISNAEKTVVSRAKEMDPQTWLLIYDRHYPRVYGYVRRRVRNDSVAEKMTSAVFSQVLEEISSNECQCTPLVAWLISIADNQVEGYLQRTDRSSKEPFDLQLISRQSTSAQSARATVLRDRLQMSLGHLPREQRQVLIMRFVIDLNTHEIGYILKRPEGAIRELQRSALDSLSSFLRSGEEDG